MRNQFLLFTAILFAAVNANATVHTLSNNGNSPGQHTTFASAQTAAANGDTIYVHGSPYNYGTFSVSKQLTIIGTGHNPQKQSPLRSFLDYAYFYTGSNGSRLIGVEVYQVNAMNDNVDNVEVKLCKILQILYIDNSFCDNWVIDGNVFVNTAQNFIGYYNMQGHRFRNNVFNGYLSDVYASGGGYHYVENNVFLRNGNAFNECYTFYVNNNIFYRANPHNGAGGSYIYSNNISYLPQASGTFPNGTNLANTNPLFVNFPGAGASFDYSHDYHLQPTSPVNAANNTMFTGIELGVYGGTQDFNQHGIPRIPYMSEFNISNPTVSPGGTLNVTFKSKVR